MSILRKILCLVFILSMSSAAAADTFVVKNINVNGLQRITKATVLSYLPVRIGEKIDSSETQDIIRALYKTKFFSDVSVSRHNNSLIITVVERPVIGSLTTTGNSKISKKQLLDALKGVGISEGQALDPATLALMEQAIIQEYYNLGLYEAKVTVDVKPEKRNRVSLAITVKEGPVAKIRSIKINGNKAFSDRKLIGEFSLTTTKPWSFITGANKYSREKLDADLEKLRSYYMDRGYLNIEIVSDKVSITPDKKGIYIVINIKEGDVYHLKGFNIEGNLIGKRSELLKSITLKPGEVFSRKQIIETQSKISLFLGDYGYAKPGINFIPEVDEHNKTLWVKFIVDPGRKMYIRHISFSGNHKTNDGVLRREMRLQEGSVFSLAKISESKRRIANLGYFEDINHTVEPVSNTNDQIDMNYTLKETSAINANIQAGYSDRDGFLYGASISDQNIFGTGKTASIRFDNTRASQYYSIGYRDPYLSANQLGLSVNAYMSKTNHHKVSADIASYKTSTYGMLAAIDIPLSDYSSYTLGMGVEHIGIGSSSANEKTKQLDDFIKKYGDVFNQFKMMASWGYSNVDRALFPTKGFAHSIGGELYGPFSEKDLRFYKLNYHASWYQPMFKGFIFHATGDLGYGDGLGSTKDFPPFKNYYAGGIGSVRGFEADTISSYSDRDKTVGGNILTLASASIIIPNPMQNTIRPSIFVDVGNVYQNHFAASDLRGSYGIQIEWRTPIAPLLFSFAKPIKKKSWDDVSVFQFSISTGF